MKEALRVLAQEKIHHNSLSFSSLSPWQRVLLIALPLLTILAYLPAIRGAYIWDDDRHVFENHTLLNLRGLEHIWFSPKYVPQYYPLTHTSFWIEYRFWGVDPVGYHIDNVLLHILNSLLLWRLLKRLDLCGAALAATIFALHPIEIESVAWISERKNLLSTCFVLLSTLAYLRRDDRRWPAKSFLLFVAAMFSKTVACTLPAVLLVIVWWKRGQLRIRDVVQLLPFIAVSIGLGWFTAHTEVDRVGAKGPDWNLSFTQRCLIASRAVWFYLGKLFWPVNLTFNYPRWTIDPHNLALSLFPVAGLILLASAWVLRGRCGRGLLASLLIFAGVLTPALCLFNTYPMRYSFVADHFQYTAGIAIIVLFSASVIRFVPQRVLVAVLAIVLASLTWRQSHAYAGPESLWRDVIDKNNSSWLALDSLAYDLTYKLNPTHEELEEAVRCYERVEKLRPQHILLQQNLADALFGLGRWDEALTHYRQAIESPGTSRQIIDDRMGQALAHLNRPADAQSRFAASLALDASDLTARSGLADALAAQGHYSDALSEYETVLKNDANQPASVLGSAMALIALNRSTDAAARLNRYVELAPNDGDARQRLARLDLELGRPGEAIEQFAAALSLEPNSENAKRGLADAIAAQAKSNQ